MNNLQTAFDAILKWTTSAYESGWLSNSDSAKLNNIERQQAATLFDHIEHRPLIVGLFGGTGVGKSSLLNRLAGEAISKTGIERPTSREVTLYLHQDFHIELLPDSIPLRQTHIAYHNQSGRRLLAWLDMPDIDSTEQGNKALVEAWLPYLDWIVYVVSPERYHDDIGWRFLQHRSTRHAWLFVMNHWDQGNRDQLEDFRKRLNGEGFTNPVVLTTSCRGTMEDDFELLEQSIAKAIEEYGFELLAQLGLEARLNSLSQLVKGYYAVLGDDHLWQDALHQWQSILHLELNKLNDRLSEAATIQSRLISSQQITIENLPRNFGSITEAVWRAREQEHIVQLDHKLLDRLQSQAVPVQPFQHALNDQRESIDLCVRESLQSGLADSLVKPGHWLQRGLYRLTTWLQLLLPLAIAAWTGLHAFPTYYSAMQGRGDFLSINFAVHSTLLIGLAWLLPWLLQHKLKPTAALIVRRGLAAGINSAIKAVEKHYRTLGERMRVEKNRRLAELRRCEQHLREGRSNEIQALSGSLLPNDPRPQKAD